MSERLTPQTWLERLRQRLRVVRLNRGLTYVDLGIRDERRARRYEADSPLYIGPVVDLSWRYGVHPHHMLDGWRGDLAGHRSPDATPVFEAEWVFWARLRRNIHLSRASKRLSAVAVATKAWGNRSLQSTISRWETGAYQTRRINLERLYRFAVVVDMSVGELVSEDLEEPCRKPRR